MNNMLSETNHELIEENQKLSFQVMELESDKMRLEHEINALEFKIKTMNQTIAKLRPKAEIIDTLIETLPMFICIGIAVILGIAVAAYYAGKSAERKEILGL